MAPPRKRQVKRAKIRSNEDVFSIRLAANTPSFDRVSARFTCRFFGGAEFNLIFRNFNVILDFNLALYFI
jgi:hypothetical protein